MKGHRRTRPGAHRAASGLRGGQGLLLVALMAICACDSKPKGTVVIEECAEYADALGACFGVKAGAAFQREFTSPPDKGEREALRGACTEQLARLRSTCR